MRLNTSQLKTITTFYDKMVTGFSLKIPDSDYYGGLSSMSYSKMQMQRMMNALNQYSSPTITSTGTSTPPKSKKQSFLDTLNEFKFGDDDKKLPPLSDPFEPF